MWIGIDLRVIPPTTVLHEADDFTSFKVVLHEAADVRVPPEFLRQLAGDRAADREWQRGLEKMLEYADQHGWLDEGGVQAHVERAS